MSYPKQEGVIPEYTGPPPIDIREPENLLDALKQSRDDRVDFFLQNPTEKDEINKSGFNGQRPLHLVCFRGDLSTAKKYENLYSDFVNPHAVEILNVSWEMKFYDDVIYGDDS